MKRTGHTELRKRKCPLMVSWESTKKELALQIMGRRSRSADLPSRGTCLRIPSLLLTLQSPSTNTGELQTFGFAEDSTKLVDIANKSTGSPVKFECQINDRREFSLIVSQSVQVMIRIQERQSLSFIAFLLSCHHFLLPAPLPVC